MELTDGINLNLMTWHYNIKRSQSFQNEDVFIVIIKIEILNFAASDQNSDI